MSTVHRGHCHASCSHVQTERSLQRSVLRHFIAAESGLWSESDDSRLDRDHDSLTRLDGALRHVQSVGGGGGGAWGVCGGGGGAWGVGGG